MFLNYKIIQKLQDGLPLNLVEGWELDQGGTHSILVPNFFSFSLTKNDFSENNIIL